MGWSLDRLGFQVEALVEGLGEFEASASGFSMFRALLDS